MEPTQQASPKLCPLAIPAFALGLLSDLLMYFLMTPAPEHLFGTSASADRWIHRLFVTSLSLPVIGLAASTTAIVAIRRSRGQLRGLALAVAGLVFACLPWGLVLIVGYLFAWLGL